MSDTDIEQPAVAKGCPQQNIPDKVSRTTSEPGGGPQQLLPDQASIDSLGSERPTDSDIISQEPSSDQNKMQWSELSDDDKKRIQREVLESTIKNDIVQLKELIKKYDGIKLEFCIDDNDHGDNPLHLAAFHGHMQIVKYLIEERDCDKECQNRYKNTPLHRAARQGQLAVVQYLVKEKECDPMCVCNWGRTPLHIACNHNHLNVVKYLMELEGINVNLKDKRHGLRPLDLAAESGSLAVVKYMTGERKCYDPSKYEGSHTPLHFAANNGKEDVVKYLTAHRIIDRNVKGNHGRTPLHSACKGGHLDVVRHLIDIANADPSCGDDEYGLTPLDLAAEHAPLEVVRYMVEDKHIQVTFPGENRYTTLQQAAYGGKLENVKFLV